MCVDKKRRSFTCGLKLNYSEWHSFDCQHLYSPSVSVSLRKCIKAKGQLHDCDSLRRVVVIVDFLSLDSRRHVLPSIVSLAPWNRSSQTTSSSGGNGQSINQLESFSRHLGSCPEFGECSKYLVTSIAHLKRLKCC